MANTPAKSNSQISQIDDDAAAAVKDATPVNELKDPVAGEGMCGKNEIVTIHSSAEDGGTDAVFLSHNGYAYQIPRDQPFKLPTEVVQVLRDAVTRVYKPGPGGTVIERNMPRFAFSATPA